MRGLFAYILSFVLAMSGFVLAEAKGASHDIGMEIVICSGVGMTTITIGPDGEPIEATEVCPEGHSIFVATMTAPDLPQPKLLLVDRVEPTVLSLLVARDEVSPSARGPPVAL
ncbi:MAG TPA: hypothetical protein DEO85_15160 [Maritimibacter sp.]|nr:hypothetical protein [Maritimibacter sp.]